MAPVLELSGIVKRFGDGFALEGVDLDLEAGEVHVVIGENGSGKSAIMKLVGGLHAPEEGTIRLSGEPVTLGSVAEAKRRGIMYRPQEPQLFENLKVAENLFFDHLPKGRWGALDLHRLRRDAEALFRELGVRLDPEEVTANLGYAQRQLLEATKACIGTWKVVVFDEPTSAMAEPERNILFSIVRRLREAGVGVFYVSHRIDEILLVGDRVSVVRQGRVLDTRPVGALDRESVVQMMTGRLRTERYPRVDRSRGSSVMEVQGLHSGHVLQGVSFAVRAREILGVTGLMGSGRTRLAQCLFGAVEPSEGTILLDGQRVRFRGPTDALERGIALVPEDRGENAILHRQDLVLNVAVASLQRFRGPAGLDPEVMQDLVQSYSRRLGVRPGRAEDQPDQYSGGNQQKVAVARWLARRSRIYILDEPTRGIDVASKVDVYNAIGDLVAKGASVILISSDIEEILGLCDRVLVLAGGRIVCDLPRGQATQELILEYATAD